MSKNYVIEDKEKKFCVSAGVHNTYTPKTTLIVNRPTEDITFESIVNRVVDHVMTREQLNNNSIDMFMIETEILPGVEVLIEINDKNIESYVEAFRDALLFEFLNIQMTADKSAKVCSSDIALLNRAVKKLNTGELHQYNS